MRPLHAKSGCCGVRIHRFGLRRRRCSRCGRTWRIRPRQRGRPARRGSNAWLPRVLLEGQTLTSLAHRTGRSPQTLSARFRQQLAQVCARPDPRPYPRGPLVLLSDGLWFRFAGQRWVLYLTALKPCQANYAVFLDPILREGREHVQRWREVFDGMPPPLQRQIRAWVCDDLPGLRGLAHDRGWILQLCHFHVISQLQVRRGHWKRQLGARPAREAIYQLVRALLDAPTRPHERSLLSQLHRTANQPGVPRRLAMIARAFTRNVAYYRAYHRHPELGLPTTTNAVESMARVVRDLLRRTRNLRSPTALRLWVTALIRLRPRITCNGKHHQPN